MVLGLSLTFVMLGLVSKVQLPADSPYFTVTPFFG